MPFISAKDKKASIVQQDEVNRIRELMLQGVREPDAGKIHAREAALAAITIAAEACTGHNLDKAGVEKELHNMVTFVMQYIEIIADTEMN